MNISNPLHKKEPVNTPQAGMPTGSDIHWNTSIFQSRTLLAPMDYTRVYKNHKFKVLSYKAMAVGLELIS